MTLIPNDFPVQPIQPDHPDASTAAQCGVCGRYWNDDLVTSMTPAPAARCPFEAFHDDEDEAAGKDLAMDEFCNTCGQLQDEATAERIWSIYHRSPDPAHNEEPLVFFASDEDEPSDALDEYLGDSRTLAMEKSMYRRGLCTACGLPDLARLDLKRYPLMDDEEMKAHYEMAAEYAAERRAGC